MLPEHSLRVPNSQDYWGDVETFLKNNQGKYLLNDACIDFIVKHGFTGRGLLSITEDTLVRNGINLGHAFTFMSLITDLKLAMGVRVELGFVF